MFRSQIPLSPVIADVVIQDFNNCFEKRNKIEIELVFYFCYVNDIP